MKTNNKKRNLILLLLVLTTLLFSCGTPSLPEGFDSTEVENRAKQIIEVINTKDYDQIHSLIREDLQPVITPKQLEEGWAPMLDSAGDFVEIDEIVLSSERGEKDVVYAIAILKCIYENENHIFTFYFDEDMELAGLYMK